MLWKKRLRWAKNMSIEHLSEMDLSKVSWIGLILFSFYAFTINGGESSLADDFVQFSQKEDFLCLAL